MVGSTNFFALPTVLSGSFRGLVFAYRDGASGNGNYIFNTTTWPIAAGRASSTRPSRRAGVVQRLPGGPVLGPDGWYHLVWVWRDTPDAATNHDLSYAKSQDLVNWQTAGGTALTLPSRWRRVTSSTRSPRARHDQQQHEDWIRRAKPAHRRLHKYDVAGATQLYNARFENGRWVPHQTSQWAYRWAFGGTLAFRIRSWKTPAAAECPAVCPLGSLMGTQRRFEAGVVKLGRAGHIVLVVGDDGRFCASNPIFVLLLIMPPPAGPGRRCHPAPA